jgi:hypothetical protein
MVRKREDKIGVEIMIRMNNTIRLTDSQHH